MGKNKIEGALPRHIAIIMDGNGRWAKKRLMPRSVGHKHGVDRMEGLLDKSFEMGISYVTLYALSTENLKRPEAELEGLYDLIRKRFVDAMRKICKKGVRLRILGDVTMLPKDVQEILRQAEEETACYDGNGKGLNIALCYGARAEIVRAANIAAEKGEKLTEEGLSALLYTSDIPDPDLIIRTGGEMRLSNFLLYQAAYAELYFSAKMFPDFSDDDLEEAVAEFARRTRRFGKTDEQCNTEKRTGTGQ
ncbi:MAG: di-trans,poly-cis-decaprenylcistransferase [Clostridia bacterium]|nr:di-trans,poly-cis-decaprenylcistransferase [Clostridia bacterium]